MSAAKRSHGRHDDPELAPARSPATKRLKTANGAHVPASGLDFLVDDDARAGRKLDAKLTNGIPRSKALRPDESSVVVAQVADSDSEDDGDSLKDGVDDSEQDDDDDDAEDGGSSSLEQEDENENKDNKSNDAHTTLTSKRATMINGHAPRETETAEENAVAVVDETMEDTRDSPEREELSFGELLASRHPQPINVATAFPDPTSTHRSIVPSGTSSALALPAGISLGTVLSQALNTNDRDLLESCLQTNDVQTIRRTIERLPSHQIATLLQRLAERMHKRPGRAGTLMVWVQWSLVAHGGYLASRPALIKKLRSLALVVRERARGLQPLLQLKGKLDLLSAQMDLRRQMQEQSRAADAADDDDDEGVLYVEGQPDQWSDGDSDDVDGLNMLDGPRRLADVGVYKDSTDPPASKAGGAHPGKYKSIPNGDLDDEEGSDLEDEEDEEDGDGMLDLEAEEGSEEEDEELDSDEEAESEPEISESSIASDNESETSGVQEPRLDKLNRRR